MTDRQGKGKPVSDFNTNPWLNKIRAMLDKAESTPFPEEAKAFSEKAQELMKQFAVSEVELEMAKSSQGKVEVVVETVWVPGPYAKAKGNLLAQVARANRCRTVHSARLMWHVERAASGESKPSQKYERVHVFGAKSDVELSILLFNSLNVQAASAMGRAEIPYGESTKAFCNSFLMGYGYQIGSRLRKASETVQTDNSTALVLVNRESAAEEKMKEMYPSLGTAQLSNSSTLGTVAGSSAARNASISNGSLGSRKSLDA